MPGRVRTTNHRKTVRVSDSVRRDTVTFKIIKHNTTTQQHNNTTTVPRNAHEYVFHTFAFPIR
ncbi:hypothetical protein BFW94_01995 [Enterobacter ludwigii]|nr:hypothetical protein AM410_20455 [Enterobacter cloacae complex sp. FDA-CDC-AR_0164]OPB26890.1 hypothetical protein BFW94_01995 [Enterobacter ludwigii]